MVAARMMGGRVPFLHHPGLVAVEVQLMDDEIFSNDLLPPGQIAGDAGQDLLARVPPALHVDGRESGG